MKNLGKIVDYLQQRGFELHLLKPKVDLQKEISGPNHIEKASNTELSFLGKRFANRAASILANSQASLVFLDASIPFKQMSINPMIDILVVSLDAKTDFVHCLRALFLKEETPSIHPTACIDASARIGKEVHIGPYAVIGAEVSIGNYCRIGAHVSIREGTNIGDRVIIDDNTVIGGRGFGYVKDPNGAYQHFPHFGKVIIESNVYIGSNSCIDRGALADTLIKRGVKIDNLVHIAHNVEIGEDTLVIACSILGGSVVIGKNCWIAPASAIRNGLHIGDDTTIGLGSVVVKDIDANSIIAGVPGRPLDELRHIQQQQKAWIQTRNKSNQ